MQQFHDSTGKNWNFQAACPLNVIIVGAGVAGLTAAIGLGRAGHEVTILEAAKEIGEVGAGIQLAPNATKILERWGLLEELSLSAVELSGASVRRWQNNEVLGELPFIPMVRQKYQAPLLVVHRADLQRVLRSAALAAGAQIRVSSQVVAVDESFAARVKLKGGEWVEGDVILAADGIKSTLRQQISSRYDRKDVSLPTGDAAYRISISKEDMKGDEEALNMLAGSISMRWMGPGGHVVAYPVKSHSVYNMILMHPRRLGSSDDESWTSKSDKRQMLEIFKDWNHRIHDLLSYVPDGEVVEWSLNTHSPLPSWFENKVILLGDSCHPMLPYVAQGAAQAIEDAAVLSIALSRITSRDEIEVALGIYEIVRKDRGERIQQSAATSQKVLHLPDGPEQRDRDDKIRASAAFQGQQTHDVKKYGNPDLWADENWQNFMWGADVMSDMYENWECLKRQVMSKVPGAESLLEDES